MTLSLVLHTIMLSYLLTTLLLHKFLLTYLFIPCLHVIIQLSMCYRHDISITLHSNDKNSNEKTRRCSPQMTNKQIRYL